MSNTTPTVVTTVTTVLDDIAPELAKLVQKVPAKARILVNIVLVALQSLLQTVILPSGTPGWVGPTLAAVLVVAQGVFIAGNTDVSKS